MKYPLIWLLAIIAGYIPATAQNLFYPTKASIVDSKGGNHEFFSSFDVSPVDVTDLGNMVTIMINGDMLTLEQERDNPFEYRHQIKAKKHLVVYTKAYRDPSSGKIDRVTVTTTKPSSDFDSIVLTFKPAQAQ